MTRVTILKPGWFDACSGISKHIVEVCTRLVQEHGYSFRLITSRVKPGGRSLMPTGIELLESGGSYYWGVRRLIAKRALADTDLCVVSGGYLSPLLVGSTSDLGVPVVCSIGSWKLRLSDYRGIRLWDYAREWRYLLSPPWLLNLLTPEQRLIGHLERLRPRGISVPSQSLQQRLQSLLPGSAVEFIPSGVDTSRFCPGDTEHAKQFLGFDPAERVILFYGRAQMQRGIDVLLCAFSVVRREHPKACLALLLRYDVSDTAVFRVVRRHPYRQAIRLVVGDIPMVTYLAAADVVVLPFRGVMAVPWQPLTLLEAMSMAKPVVTTSLPTTSEFMEDGKNGIVVAVGDTDALAEGITKVLDNPSMASDLGREARRLMVSCYDWSIVAEQTHRLYQHVLRTGQQT